MDNISSILFQEAVKAFKKKKYNQTLALITKLKERENDNPVINYLEAYSYYRLDEIKHALPILKSIVIKSLKREITLKAGILLGYILIKKNDFTNAKKFLLMVAEKRYDHPTLFSLLGYVEHKLENYESAEKFFQRSLELAPDDPTHNNNLGYNYLFGKKNPRLAEKYIQKAFEKNENNVNYIHSIGWYYFLSKNAKKSKEMFKKAFSLKSEDNTIREHYNLVKRMH